MRFTSFTGALALCASASAFTDTSPFILASTADLALPESIDQLQSNTHVLASAKALLSTCPTSSYLVISQPKLHSRDLALQSAAPTLYNLVHGAAIKSTYSVAGMYGEIASEDLLSYIRGVCAGKDVTIRSLPLEGLPEVQREEKVTENDEIIGEVVAARPLGASYSVLYLSDVSDIRYEAQLGNLVKGDFAKKHGVRGNVTDTRAFFEKYQLFNNGLYMVLTASFFMITILYVGIRALASLEVSVGAFDADMGPAAQKKHQ